MRSRMGSGEELWHKYLSFISHSELGCPSTRCTRCLKRHPLHGHRQFMAYEQRWPSWGETARLIALHARLAFLQNLEVLPASGPLPPSTCHPVLKLGPFLQELSLQACDAAMLPRCWAVVTGGLAFCCAPQVASFWPFFPFSLPSRLLSLPPVGIRSSTSSPSSLLSSRLRPSPSASLHPQTEQGAAHLLPVCWERPP